MNAAEGDLAIMEQGLAARLGPAIREVLAEANEQARLTGSPEIEAGHLALAVLSRADCPLDALLQRRFGGLRAKTLAASLHDILEIEAERRAATVGAPAAAELPRHRALARAAQAGLARASAAADSNGLATVSLLALTRALFEPPPPAVAEAFRDAGIGASEIAGIVRQLPEEGEAKAPGRTAEVFRDGQLNLAALGPTARGAATRLAGLAGSAPERPITDADLLACLLAEEESQLATALHVLGLSPVAIRRSLTRSAPQEAGPSGAAALAEQQLSRLLRRVFQEAAALAAAEHCPLISESHLVRAHLTRLGNGPGNLYQRLAIDPSRLRAFLERYPTDREPDFAGTPGSGEIADVDLEGFLRSVVINQDDAIQQVLPVLKRMRVGLAEPGRPLGVFLFLGPTGVGKTELARAIASVAFGSRPKERDAFLIKLDCGNFQERRDIVQLLGASQGLVGYKEGQLSAALRQKPRSVILFDEAEKADAQIWQSLLPLFDEGILREADGTELDATGCILVATSNKGYSEAIQQLHLWDKDFGPHGALPQEAMDLVLQHVAEYFSPEFRGRFGRENMIFFRHFDRASYGAIVRLQVGRLVAEMAGHGLSLNIPEPVADRLAELAWQERQEGARPVRRLVDKHLRHLVVEAREADRQRSTFSFIALEGRGEIRLRD